MKRPEDLSWDRVVERIELDASAADLAAAERALREAESDVVRPELIESVLAQAQAEQAAEFAAPLAMPQPRIRTLPRMRRFAAAAAAFFFGSKLSAATTVTVFAVVTTVTALVVRNSTWELSYSSAIRILQSCDASKDAPASALSVVSNGMQEAIQRLRTIRDDGRSTVALADQIAGGLRAIGDRGFSPIKSSVDDIWLASRLAVQGASEPERIAHVQDTLSLLDVGMRTIEELSHPELRVEREHCLRRLRGMLRH
jgi:hypothetical protein